jgi:hypothetical protein
VLFFIVLMFVPLFTVMDGTGTPGQAVGVAVAEPR